MADPTIADLIARIDQQAADLLLLRQQLSGGAGLPDMTGNAGLVLGNDGTLPIWGAAGAPATNGTSGQMLTSDGAGGFSTPLTRSIDTLLSGNSDTNIPTQKAVKTYVDNTVTSAIAFQGSISASSNPNYPAAAKGQTWVISVAGRIGGASGALVDVGDMILAIATNAGGTQASVGANWNILEHNLQGALLASNNLSELPDRPAARSNLGLGSLATLNSIAWGTITGSLSSQTDLNTALNARGALASANTWSNTQTFTSYANYVNVAAAQYGLDYSTSVTPTVGNWYRVATLPATNVGQEAVLYIGVGSGSYRGAYKFTVTKTTSAGGGFTKCEMELLGRFVSAAGVGILSARIVDAGINAASYLDIQFADATTYSVVVESTSVALSNNAASLATLGLVSQGNAAAGTSWSVDGYMRVLADTTNGIIYARTSAGALTENKVVTFGAGIGLPGTISQYVRGDGTLATFPSSSGTVTSVQVSGGSTGLSFTGGPITTSGTITLSGTLALANGGTGATTQGGARTALGLGTAATQNTGTSGATVPLLNTSCTWTGTQTFATITASTVTDTSDRRIKAEIVELRGGLDIVRALLPCRFRNLATERDDVGFVAQQVALVLPELVVADDDGILSLAYQRLTAPIVAAMQEIDARLARLESRP